MKDNPPNEKLLETLFDAFLFRYFEPGKIRIYTPTSREEYKTGYDTKIIGASDLLLQFKSPSRVRDNSFSVSINPHQHQILIDEISTPKYRINSAHYILPTFLTIKEINDLMPEGSEPLRFLE